MGNKNYQERVKEAELKITFSANETPWRTSDKEKEDHHMATTQITKSNQKYF